MKHRIAAVASIGFLLSTTTYGDSPPNIVEALQTGLTLEAGEIDSTTVEVGAFAVVIHGLGERHPVSGKWERLQTVRGYIQAIDGKTLTLSQGRDGRLKSMAVKRLQTLILVGPSSGRSQNDSLHVKRGQFGGFRLFKKVAAGTLSGVVFSGVSIVSQYVILSEEDPDKEQESDLYKALGISITGGAIGCSVGFPLGVTLVDPHDSLPRTLLAGVIPAAAGFYLLAAHQERFGTGILLTYVVPVTNSLIASELWRKPPQDRRVSFGLSPNLAGDLSILTTLRF